jgi:hypothetical protein
MYNFNLKKNEKLVYVLDDVLVNLNDNEYITTVALTTKRILFLDYYNIDEELRIAKYKNEIKFKEVYYDIDLKNIDSVNKFTINLKNNTNLKIYDKTIINLICENKVK